MLELITREKATHSDNNSLVNNFLEPHKKEKKATEYFDRDIASFFFFLRSERHCCNKRSRAS